MSFASGREGRGINQGGTIENENFYQGRIAHRRSRRGSSIVVDVWVPAKLNGNCHVLRERERDSLAHNIFYINQKQFSNLSLARFYFQLFSILLKKWIYRCTCLYNSYSRKLTVQLQVTMIFSRWIQRENSNTRRDLANVRKAI